MKKQLAIIWHSLGCLSGQFYLLIQAIKKAEENFKEFDKWLDKEIKKEKLKIK